MPTYTRQENEIFNDIIKIAERFNIGKLVECSDKSIAIYCDNILQRVAILNRADDLMHEKYPDVDYTSVKISDLNFEIRLES